MSCFQVLFLDPGLYHQRFRLLVDQVFTRQMNGAVKPNKEPGVTTGVQKMQRSCIHTALRTDPFCLLMVV